MRERGLKFVCKFNAAIQPRVAPHAGAWIEILSGGLLHHHLSSLPMRERGLKYVYEGVSEKWCNVAPHAGAWIEILRAYAVT